jgi:hypothetical protein
MPCHHCQISPQNVTEIPNTSHAHRVENQKAGSRQTNSRTLVGVARKIWGGTFVAAACLAPRTKAGRSRWLRALSIWSSKHRLGFGTIGTMKFRMRQVAAPRARTTPRTKPDTSAASARIMTRRTCQGHGHSAIPPSIVRLEPVM